jgi:TRAP-type C4-dicarboxylate transport system permease small subunit
MGNHVRVNLLDQKVGKRTRIILDFFTATIGAVVCAIVAWQGAIDTLDAYIREVLIVGPVTVPKWLITWIIPFGLLLFSSYFLRNAFRFFYELVSISSIKK